MNRGRILTALLFVGAAMPIAAQSNSFTPLRAGGTTAAALAVRIDVDVDSVPLIRLLQDVIHRAGVGFTFDRALPGLSGTVSLHLKQVAVSEVLLRALEQSPLEAAASSAGHIVLLRRTTSGRRVAAVRGAVLDAGGAPVAGAHVELVDAKRSTVSADDGSFTIPRVPPGDYALRVTRIGYQPAAIANIHAAGDSAATGSVVISLEAAPVPLSAVVVSPGYFGIGALRLESGQSLGREEIRTRPQLGEDLFRSINRLPGLTSNDFAAGFHARGADVDQLYVSLDGLQLCEPFHLKDLDGALSILDVKSVEGVDLTMGGFTSEYGGRLGSVLAIRSAEPRTDRAATELALSVTSVRAQTQGGFANGRGSWIASARRGYIDFALRLAGVSDSLSPRYADAFAKVSYDLNARNRVSVHALWADDALRYEESSGAIGSRYGSGYGWLTWDTQPSAIVRATTVLSISGLGWHRTGSVDNDRNAPDRVIDRRSFRSLGARQDWSLDLGSRVLMRWGADLQSQRASYDYDGTHTTRFFAGDTVADAVRHLRAALSPTGTVLGMYASPRIQPVSWLVAEVGGRYDRVSYTGDALFSPRANARITLGPRTALRLAMGRYTQPQTIYGLQVQDSVNSFASADVSEHRVAGLEQQLGATTVRVEGYDRRTTREHPRFINLLVKTETFPEAGGDRVLLDATSGRARGVEVLARHSAVEGISWSASYAHARTTDVVDGVELPRGYDQEHTAYVDASYRPARASWRFNIAWQTHSGWPTAPVRFELDTARTAKGNSLPVFLFTRYGPIADIGKGRLPWYHRTDVRFTRDVETSHGRLSFFGDVFNLFNGSNPRSYDYSTSLRGGILVVTPVPNPQVMRMPSFGVSWEF